MLSFSYFNAFKTPQVNPVSITMQALNRTEIVNDEMKFQRAQASESLVNISPTNPSITPRTNITSANGMVLGDLPKALNILEGNLYNHHPVILNVPLKFYPVEKQYVVELNGLRIPAEYDCDIFNNNKHWGNHFYFYEVPSRWYNCYNHQVVLNSGVPQEMPMYPIVDDEYIETVCVFQAAMRAIPARGFVVAELGARWGTWGSRAVKMLQVANPMSHFIYFVEADKGNCEGVNAVGKKNSLNYELFCDYASSADFKRFAALHGHIDLMDIDIQGAEKQFVDETFDILSSKVYRLIIGTHSPDIHRSLKLKFQDWILISDVPHTTEPCKQSTGRYTRGSYDPKSPDRFKWDRLIQDGCFYDSPFGKVNQWDGELIVDNPKFISRSKSMKLTDTTLVVDDLIPFDTDKVVI